MSGKKSTGTCKTFFFLPPTLARQYFPVHSIGRRATLWLFAFQQPLAWWSNRTRTQTRTIYNCKDPIHQPEVNAKVISHSGWKNKKQKRKDKFMRKYISKKKNPAKATIRCNIQHNKCREFKSVQYFTAALCVNFGLLILAYQLNSVRRSSRPSWHSVSLTRF